VLGKYRLCGEQAIIGESSDRNYALPLAKKIRQYTRVGNLYLICGVTQLKGHTQIGGGAGHTAIDHHTAHPKRIAHRCLPCSYLGGGEKE